MLGVSPATITNWELNRTRPVLRSIPGLIRLLGPLPIPSGETIPARLRACRTSRGLSQETAARLLGVDPGTLRRWESGERTLKEPFLTQIRAFMADIGEDGVPR